MLGTFTLNNCNQITKIFSNNFDFIIIDREHGPHSYENVKNLLNSSNSKCLRLVRCSHLNKIEVQRTLETNPDGIYGLTKLKSEKIIKKYFKKNYAILRYFNVVGASPSKKIGQIEKADQLFKNLSSSILKKTPVFNIYGNDYETLDGTCVRDYIHVSDLADIHIKTLIKINTVNKSIILNCGYGKGLSVLKIINQFQKLTKKKVRINFKERRKGDIVEIIANVDKLKRFLTWKPKFNNLRKMVKSSIDWEKELN